MDGNTAGFQCRWTAGARVNPPVARVPAFPVGSKSTPPDFTAGIAARFIRAFFIRENPQPSENYFALLAITRPAKDEMIVLERLSQILRNENGRRSPRTKRSHSAAINRVAGRLPSKLRTLGKDRGYYEAGKRPRFTPMISGIATRRSTKHFKSAFRPFRNGKRSRSARTRQLIEFDRIQQDPSRTPAALPARQTAVVS